VDTKTKILFMVLTVTSIAIIPTLICTDSVNAVETNSAATSSGWCATQEKGADLISYCKQGWYDHDHCEVYDPQADLEEKGAAYKKGWDHGSCKH
jgi:hypothetical protein